MNKEIFKENIKNNIELAVDIASIGGMSLGGITAVLGIAIINPVFLVSGIISTTLTVLAYNSVKDDFEQMKVRK